MQVSVREAVAARKRVWFLRAILRSKSRNLLWSTNDPGRGFVILKWGDDGDKLALADLFLEKAYGTAPAWLAKTQLHFEVTGATMVVWPDACDTKRSSGMFTWQSGKSEWQLLVSTVRMTQAQVRKLCGYDSMPDLLTKHAADLCKLRDERDKPAWED